MEQIKISAKNLGQVMLDDFCPRCFYLKLKVKALPFQIFPGIFSSLDSYQKKCVHSMIDTGCSGFITTAKIKQWHKVPHHSKFFKEYPELGITLTGGPDDIIETVEDTFIIPDYKTAKYSANQDKLLPMYQVQLNCYKEIAEVCGYKPVTDLKLIYFEPVTDDESAKAKWTLQGYKMDFMAYTLPCYIDKILVTKCLETTRKIYDLQEAPEGRKGCKDCEATIELINVLSRKITVSRE
jgi:hypothetical protein